MDENQTIYPPGEFPYLLEELKARIYSLDPSYEYCEIEISEVRKSLLIQTSKDVQEGKIDLDSPGALAMVDFSNYLENYLPSLGWEVYELAFRGKLHEIRRLRRLIKLY